ncbi:hypothetical protein DPMN_064999 [Dreissena polymorpha]|uniref:Uncharacterized protein n=1 Tax=Dreissena polymorpha TaxID=45954 RepID=A0A9D4CDS5_DREPO|nr:hypothetical protein DPMN_064999 [Dreissena polymorpha]
MITREQLSMEHHESGQVDIIGLLSTSCQVLRELDVTQLVDDFDQLKCRKRAL